ncbi:TonB-dependent siderophore receptor [Chroococcidiopsis sp. FACHB-1243]|uniref:TonB-dependent siderophore receptor n=1 Tax=Chroococcidiopsis sp. [FACHB-1243] TaxID=2692781 RepID=UPI0017805301|nr:TonB-dependent siderophore receptor [Chroococcidiopsis sp. [FACHB-1243]]MBD2303986.1 TonB-dependent siderophore receptor [Chroococcidiopsis sp. [FACHB-1243]]
MLKLWWRSLFLAGVFSVSIVPVVCVEDRVFAQSAIEMRSAITITGVRLSQTDSGLEVVLETNSKQPLSVVTSSYGKTYVANITNAQLSLPEGKSFRQENPIEGIAVVSVTQQGANGIRIIAIGSQDLPTAKLRQSNGSTIFSLTTPTTATAQTPTPAPPTPETSPPQTPPQPGETAPEAQGEAPAPQAPTSPDGTAPADEEQEIVVTGEQEETGYSVPNASTATKTDTPIRDIPQSIQVVPQQVLEDRNVRDVTQAVETVSGVVDAGTRSRIIRGFQQGGNFRNGYQDAPNVYILSSPIGTIEQVEVLKGPASVLFGGLEPGGIVNLTTKQPLSEPVYDLEFEVGNRNFYWPTVDLSGPLTTDENLLYRFIASYQSTDGFQDFVNTDQTTIAPSIALKLGERTNLNLYYEYTDFSGNPPEGSSALLSDGSLTPRNRYIGYPDFADEDISAQRFGYTLTHEFNDNWQIRNNFAALDADTKATSVYATAIEDDRFATIEAYDTDYGYNIYFGQIDLLGKFNTGSISHQLLFGFDFNDFTDDYQGLFNTNLPVQDILNPNYDILEPEYEPYFEFENQVDSYGLYLQDQIALGDRVKLLIGGRYDWISSSLDTIDFSILGNPTDESVRYDGAFSPRIGLVYQPSDTISLYASYSRSFRAQTGFASTPLGFDPTRGTQYEVGIKADFLDSRLSTTLAAYHLTKTNVITDDPNNPQFSIQTGEQRSQGIELDIAGEILPGWKAIASYAYTDAEVTEDNTFPVGNRLPGVPENQASLWTTYEIQKGSLQGLGFGLGLFYVGDRQGDLDNSFEIGDYFRTDAALYYRKGQFNAAINIRNLFDTDYISASDGGRTFLQRGAPFTITGSVSWEF